MEVYDKTSYADDIDSGGASKFFQSRINWAFSSTGNFLDDDRPRDSYTLTNNASISGTNSGLYMDARLSPLSLTYYGFCMLNGNYTVNLHFAEIMFTDDRTYSSLGRRIFDLYIQVSIHPILLVSYRSFHIFKRIRNLGSRRKKEQMRSWQLR